MYPSSLLINRSFAEFAKTKKKTIFSMETKKKKLTLNLISSNALHFYFVFYVICVAREYTRKV